MLDDLRHAGRGGSWKPITDGSTYDDKPHWAPGTAASSISSRTATACSTSGRAASIRPPGSPRGQPYRVTAFDSPRQMISSQLARMQIAVTSDRLFLPITETQSELWMLENVDR